MLPPATYELADGTRHEARRFRIRSLQIGQLELQNVTGSVAPAGGSLLLGQSFLSRLPGWSIDNQREVLIVGDAKNDQGEDAPSNVQQAQARIEKRRQFVACTEPFMADALAKIKLDDQLAVLYPRFGLLWNEWKNLNSQCSGGNGDADPAHCGAEALQRAHADFVERVAATAEPDAVRDFNLCQTSIHLLSEKMTQTCGKPP